MEARDNLGDAPYRNTSTVVIIRVLDENDNLPHFTPSNYNFSVSECARIGDPVGSVTAQDRDLNFDPFYYIVSGADGHFSINDKTSGEDFFF